MSQVPRSELPVPPPTPVPENVVFLRPSFRIALQGTGSSLRLGVQVHAGPGQPAA